MVVRGTATQRHHAARNAMDETMIHGAAVTPAIDFRHPNGDMRRSLTKRARPCANPELIHWYYSTDVAPDERRLLNRISIRAPNCLDSGIDSGRSFAENSSSGGALTSYCASGNHCLIAHCALAIERHPSARATPQERDRRHWPSRALRFSLPIRVLGVRDSSPALPWEFA